MASPHEIAENRQGELLYLSSRLMSAIFAFHRDAERSQPDRNLWWHVHLNTALVCSITFSWALMVIVCSGLSLFKLAQHVL